MTIDQFLWTEKYRPQKIKDCILPNSTRILFERYVDQENIPNLILSGPAGTGKTSCAKAMIEEIGCQHYTINASLHGNIDTLRNEILQFSSSVSLDGKRKYVILDEADYLNPNSFQPALRAFMEEFAKATGFILTCNYKSRIIEPIHSRCPSIEFRIAKEDYKDVATQLFNRLKNILALEKIEYEKPVLVELIKKFFPDFRRILGELQRYCQATGKLDSGILNNFTEARLESLVKFMFQKDFTSVREWVTDNSDINPNELFRKFYDKSLSYFAPETIPILVMILGKYQYQSSFVSDQDINTAACLAEVMVECEFKK